MKPAAEQAMVKLPSAPSGAARVLTAGEAKAGAFTSASTSSPTAVAVSLARPNAPTPGTTSSVSTLVWPGAGLLVAVVAVAVVSINFRLALVACMAQPWLIARLRAIYRRARACRAGLAAAIVMHTESPVQRGQAVAGSPRSDAATIS